VTGVQTCALPIYVVDWVDFSDFGIYIDSSLTFIDANSLVGFTTLYLVVWGVD
jgi:hypothetical protein